MLNNVPIEKILFLDIETVPEVYELENLDPVKKELYFIKNKRFLEQGETEEEVYEKAGIFAEFGKIVCISCGIVQRREGGRYGVRMRSFADDDEKKLLYDFKNLLDQYFANPDHLLCGHNAKEFDFPFIARRMLIQGVQLPAALDIAGKKPWEVNHLDTLQLWKFGDYKHYTSLQLLTNIFNIPTPKDDISGADVGKVYWEENDLDRIITYCQKDVIALIQLFLRYRGDRLIDEEDVTYT